MKTISVITGDGLSQILMTKVIRFLKPLNPNIKFDIFEGKPDKNQFIHILDSVKNNKVALKGFWNTSLETSSESINHAFRRDLDLWANLVHVKSIPGISPRTGIDLYIIRQNTEGEYSQIEHESAPGYVEMYKVITKQCTKQISNFAFEFAKLNQRKKITCVHKANIMKMGDGLFLSTAREESKSFPEIEFNDLIVDNTAMQLVMRPNQFDILLLPNLYGNIMVSIAAGLVGSSGLLAGVNLNGFSLNDNNNSNTDSIQVFESATRSVANLSHSPEHLNPVSLIFAYCKLLKYIGEDKLVEKLEICLRKSFENKSCLTPDIGGSCTTDQFLDKLQGYYDKIKE